MTAYAVRADIELQFGQTNVTEWASMDGVVVEADVTAKVTEALAAAQDDVDGVLRGGPYTVPFTTVPGPIKRVTSTLAGVWLHRSRGLVNVDGDDPKSLASALTKLHDQAMNRLADIRAGRYQLDDDSITSLAPEVDAFVIDADDVLP